MGLPFNEIVRYVMGGFNPLSWFAAGEQGAWYDPSDLTTLFQDAAGTTPVTLSPMEQPVGFMLDKSKGLVLGSELVANGDFTKGTTGWDITAGGGVTLAVVNGELEITATASGFIITSPITTIIGNTYSLILTARKGTYQYTPTVGFSLSGNTAPVSSVSITTITNTSYRLIYTATQTTTYINIRFPVVTAGTMYLDNVSVKQIAGNHAFQATAGNRPLLSARVNLLLATATLSTQSVTTVATSYVLAFSGAGTVTLSGTATGVLSAGSNTFTATAGALTLTVSGSVTLADLRPTNSGALLPAYQRVNTATDYDTVGFPLYLKCNGSSSAMATNSINFTATDKMTVVTGAGKTLDNVFILMELGVNASTTNGFNIVSANYKTNLFGTSTISKTYSGVQVIPSYNVVTTKYDIALSTVTDEIVFRNNGTILPTTDSGTTAGSGNFSNSVLYLFARIGTSLFYTGNFYGAIIRGAQSDTNSVVQTEQYMAKQTGITF